MNLQSLRPARDFAQNFGVKALIFGAPGSAKTPLINTAPKPVLLACEPGLLSMKGSTVPTFQAFTPAAIDDFFKWFFSSAETKNFDTIAIDSVSQMADIYLQDALKSNKHGLKAYGEMATRSMEHLRQLYFTQYKHTYLICKEMTFEGIKKPYFPGQQMLVEVPHMFDEILHLGIHNIPGIGQLQSFQCRQSSDILARDRTGQLAEFEPPDFGAIVKKAMG